MAQTWNIDTIIPGTTSPATDIQKIIDGFDALRTLFDGASEPSDIVAYMLWADTTAGVLKIRNAANNAWIVIGTLASVGLGLLSRAGGDVTGGINEAKTTVASATTPDIFATAVGNLVDYTGTTLCTGFVAAPQAGAKRVLLCAAAAQFTAGANLIIDGVASGTTYTCEAGDRVEVIAGTTTQFRLAICRVSGDGSNDGVSIINSQSAAYTLVLADRGKTIWHPTADNNARAFTIPANASVPYPIGTLLTFINEINTVTIPITTDTMVLSTAGTTGTRTLAANGIAIARKVSATRWYISGSGLT